jgi:hypothetical protein
MRITGVTDRITSVSCHEYLPTFHQVQPVVKKVGETFAVSPEADDKADDDLNGWDKPAHQVGRHDRLNNFSIGGQTVQKLSYAHCVEECDILAEHIAKDKRAQSARASGSCNSIQNTRKKSQHRICDVNGQQNKRNPVQLILPHAEI